MVKCQNCGTEISSWRKYCSKTCQRHKEYKDYIQRWKLGEEDGMRGEYGLSVNIRNYLFEKYNSSCAECGWSETNPFSGTIPLEVEHIDGNHTNNSETNLTLLCPNCHSLTKSYKGANKGNGRKERKKYS